MKCICSCTIIAISIVMFSDGFVLAQLPDTVDLNQGQEDVRILGDDPGDRLAFTSANGDINGDDIDDIVISAWAADPNGRSEAGEIYIVYGRTDMSANINLALSQEDVRILGDDVNDRCFDLATGDINRDGYTDIVIGAFYADPPGGADAGETYVIYGSPYLPDSIDLGNAEEDVRILGDDGGDNSGYMVECCDVNGDNYGDIIIGAFNADPPGGNEAGEVYVIYGSNTLPDTINLANGEEDVRILGDDSGDVLGYNYMASGNFNKDSFHDLILCASYADASGGVNNGKVYIILGSSSLQDTIDLDKGEEDAQIIGDDNDDQLGGGAVAGDINGDGYDDIIIGATWADPHGEQSGEAYIIFGRWNLPSTIDLANGEEDVRILGDDEGDHFGAHQICGDFNKDGFDDIVIGGYRADPPGGANAGEMYLFYGSISLPDTIDLNNGEENVRILGDDAGDHLGAVSSGDINGDGVDDIILGADQTGHAGGTGKVYIIFSPTDFNPTIEHIVESEGGCYRNTPCFVNFGFDDDKGLDDGWYKIDNNDWILLFSNCLGTSWDNNGWCLPDSLFSNLSDGGHVIYFKVSDDKGNVAGESGELGWQFYKDTIPPDDPTNVTSPSHTPSAWSNDNTVEVTWTDATDDPEECGVEGYSILWDNYNNSVPDTMVDISIGIESVTSQELPDGDNHYFHMRSKDIAGNWQNTVHVGPFHIDVTPPTIIIECVDTIRSLEEPCFFFQGEDNYTPENELVYSYFRVGKDGSFSTFDLTNYVCWDVLQGGPYTLWVMTRDLAGNISSTHETVFYYFPECRESKKGDPNFDCKINVLDVLFVANIILELVDPTEDEMWRADCNGPVGNCEGDGRINVLDAVKIANLILELDECL